MILEPYKASDMTTTPELYLFLQVAVLHALTHLLPENSIVRPAP